jgi:hypothetical protein
MYPCGPIPSGITAFALGSAELTMSAVAAIGIVGKIYFVKCSGNRCTGIQYITGK